MFFWKRKTNWEDEYDEYYTRDIDRGGGKARFRYLPHLLLLVFVGTVFCTVVGVVSGVTMLEKLLTSLVMPAGILWLFLLVTIYFCLLNRQAWPAFMCFVSWIFLTVAGNAWFVNWYASTIEQPFFAQDLVNLEPLDVLVVLGGGTNTRYSGQPQANRAGDRIVQAARLWHAGKAKKIMCTGRSALPTPGGLDLHPFEEATQILEELGVAPEDILKLNGINTFEEMSNLKKWSDAVSEPGNGTARIGIVTSATHLPRAMRLAKTHGIDCVPVAADFSAYPMSTGPSVIIPSEANLKIAATVTKEYLAGLVDR